MTFGGKFEFVYIFYFVQLAVNLKSLFLISIFGKNKHLFMFARKNRFGGKFELTKLLLVFWGAEFFTGKNSWTLENFQLFHPKMSQKRF